MTGEVLRVSDLKAHFFTRNGVIKAVDGVSFEVNPGEIVGLVGESGSGKSVTGFALLGLIDPPGRVVAGSITVLGEEIVGRDETALRHLRGRQIAMIFQDPMMTLNPVLRIDTQMIEAVKAHARVSEKAARARAVEVLAEVGIPSPAERLNAYPHHFSGGMRQRVAIAIALLHRPALIIADEPTTALDVTIQSQILAQIQQLSRETGTALLWITHDLSVVSNLADRVLVMYAGRIVEQGTVAEILHAPRHPYTAGLIGSMPGAALKGTRLAQIPGAAPSLGNLPPGCAFAPRCAQVSARCQAEAPEIRALAGRVLRCHHPLAADLSAQPLEQGA